MATVNIKGMSCPHCVASTTEALGKIPGIKNVKVDLDKAEASYDGDVSVEEVKEIITQVGFEVWE